MQSPDTTDVSAEAKSESSRLLQIWGRPTTFAVERTTNSLQATQCKRRRAVGRCLWSLQTVSEDGSLRSRRKRKAGC